MRSAYVHSAFPKRKKRKIYPSELHRIKIRRMINIDGYRIYAIAVANDGVNALANTAFTRFEKFARTR